MVWLPLSLATVNTAAYEALPVEVRRAVDAAAAETEARQWAAIRTRLDENYARMRANGVTISTAVAPELAARLRQAAQSVIDEWQAQAGPEAAAVLKRYRGGQRQGANNVPGPRATSWYSPHGRAFPHSGNVTPFVSSS